MQEIKKNCKNILSFNEKTGGLIKVQLNKEQHKSIYYDVNETHDQWRDKKLWLMTNCNHFLLSHETNKNAIFLSCFLHFLIMYYSHAHKWRISATSCLPGWSNYSIGKLCYALMKTWQQKIWKLMTLLISQLSPHTVLMSDAMKTNICSEFHNDGAELQNVVPDTHQQSNHRRQHECLLKADHRYSTLMINSYQITARKRFCLPESSCWVETCE